MYLAGVETMKACRQGGCVTLFEPCTLVVSMMYVSVLNAHPVIDLPQRHFGPKGGVDENCQARDAVPTCNPIANQRSGYTAMQRPTDRW